MSGIEGIGQRKRNKSVKGEEIEVKSGGVIYGE